MTPAADHTRRRPAANAALRGWMIAVGLAVGLAAPAVAADCPRVDHAHAAWSTILARRVSDGQVDYAALKRDDQTALGAYLTTLSGTCAADYASWTSDQKLAFWINAYNAFTIRLVLDHYPVASIRKIGWLPLAAFRERFIPMPDLKGGTISLNDIEHDTLRASFKEARIHFALVCASRSCPVLRGEAYRAADLDRQLDDQARGFLNDARRNRVDVPGRILQLSAIFNWFRDDFEAAAGSVPAYVARYADLGRVPPPAFRIEYLDYDWALNEPGKDFQ